MMIYDKDEQSGFNRWKQKEDYDTPKNIIFSFKSVNPSKCFNKIMSLGPRALILTSGTLAPLETFE